MKTVLKIKKTFPGKASFHHFEELHRTLYASSELNRKVQVQDSLPSIQHLEGCYVFSDANELVGRFAFYENPELKYQGERAACIGKYECISDVNISHFVLEEAKKIARNKGYSWLIGPMEGSTWNAYRFSTHHDFPPFFLEPYHHLYYNEQFAAAGFVSLADYHSTRDMTLKVDGAFLDKMEGVFKTNDLICRNIRLKKWEEELRKIWECSCDSFMSNFLYTPIRFEAFYQKYLPLKKLIDPDFVLLVENKQNETIAFMFALPDLYETNGTQLIIKTLAKRKGAIAGLGNYLVSETTQIAARKGYKSIIHAMMARGNAKSMQISQRYQSVSHSEYTLYGIRL